MGSVEELAEQLGVKLVGSRENGLISTGSALDLLKSVHDCNVRVLGLDGFTVRTESVSPRMDLILDLSEVEDAEESVVEAITFLQRFYSEDVLWDLVLE